jgi:hypothetical protein
MSTTHLLEKLNALEESPWGDLLHGRSLDARGLARRLRPYGVRPRTVRLDEGPTPKGYARTELMDAWDRYLPPSPETPPPPPQPPHPEALQSGRAVVASIPLASVREAVADPSERAVLLPVADVAEVRLSGSRTRSTPTATSLTGGSAPAITVGTSRRTATSRVAARTGTARCVLKASPTGRASDRSRRRGWESGFMPAIPVRPRANPETSGPFSPTGRQRAGRSDRVPPGGPCGRVGRPEA